MQITKRPDAENPKFKAKQKALEGCDKCPCCGETKEIKLIFFNGGYQPDKQGIKCLGEFFYGSMFNLFSHTVITRYECHTCGAEWQSEPYERV